MPAFARAMAESLLAARATGYGRVPQVVTDGRTPDQVADAVLQLVEARGSLGE